MALVMELSLASAFCDGNIAAGTEGAAVTSVPRSIVADCVDFAGGSFAACSTIDAAAAGAGVMPSC